MKARWLGPYKISKSLGHGLFQLANLKTDVPLKQAINQCRLIACHQRPSEVKPDQVKPDEVKPDQVKPDEMKPDQMKPDKVKPDEVKPKTRKRGLQSATGVPPKRKRVCNNH